MVQPHDNALARSGRAARWPAAPPTRGERQAHLRPPPIARNLAQASFVRVVRHHGDLVLDGRVAADFGTPGRDAIGWARWRWNGHSVLAETCRYGIRPLFYYAGRDRIMIAPTIATLLALGAPDELDPEALAVFLRFGNFLTEDTPFKHIRALPPGARLEWSDSLRLSGALYRPPSLVLSTRSRALDAYIDVFRRAIERMVEVSSLVPLSGGCDSRHIAFEVARRRLVSECITVNPLPPRSDDDTRIAARVAAALGAPHTILEQDRDRYDATVRATAETSYCGPEHVWFRPLAAYLDDLAGANPDVPVLDGLAGDVLSAGLFLEAQTLDLFRRGRLNELARHYLRRTVHLPFLADPELFSARVAADRLARELERHQTAANPVGSFFFWNRTRRIVALQFLALLPNRTVLTPYLDPDVFEFLAALPAEMFLDHRFHREALHRAFPEFAAIEFSTLGQRAGGNAAPRGHFRRYGRAILRRLDGHPSRIINLRYARPRIGYLAWSGSAAACWTADACLYLSQLEYAARAAEAGAPI